MAKKPRPQVMAVRDEHGRIVAYHFRLQGRLWPLPGAPGSPAFVAEYERLRAEAAETEAMGEPGKRKRERLSAVVWTPTPVKLPPCRRSRPPKPDDSIYLLARLSRDEASVFLRVLQGIIGRHAYRSVEADPFIAATFVGAAKKVQLALTKKLGGQP